MRLKIILSVIIILLLPSISCGVEKEPEEYDERCLSRIQDHLSKTLLEWGKITSKIPTETDISKNILEVGIYIADQESKQWIFYKKQDELYVSGYCKDGNPRTVKTGRMNTAMQVIDKIPDLKNIQWKTLKEKNMKYHITDFQKRGLYLSGTKFDSTNYGHTEQAFLSDLLDLEKVGDYSKYKVVVVMSSSNVACDQCASSLTFSIYNHEFQFKDRVIEYFNNYKNKETIEGEILNWDKIPEVSMVFSSYDYRNIDGIKKIGHNKTYIFP